MSSIKASSISPNNPSNAAHKHSSQKEKQIHKEINDYTKMLTFDIG